MADYEELQGVRKWVADRLKLNPAQASIASLEPYASPETIVDFEQAYREIEVVHRSVEMIINACIEIPMIVEGSSPAKKVNKILNIKPNPFEDRVRLFRQLKQAQLTGQLGQTTGALGQSIGALGMQTAGLGQLGQQMGTQDINTLLGIGGLEQGQLQNSLDIARANSLAEQALPYQQIGFMSDIFRGVPSLQQTYSQRTAPGPSKGSQMLGLGIAGLGAVGQAGGFSKMFG